MTSGKCSPSSRRSQSPAQLEQFHLEKTEVGRNTCDGDGKKESFISCFTVETDTDDVEKCEKHF